MPTIIQPIHDLVNAAITEQESKKIPRDEPLISISTRTSVASFVYERMRNAVDYREEHLLRRNAIERILRRRISAGERSELAEKLTEELIHARYLPNNAIPRRKLKELEAIFKKYFLLLGVAPIKEIGNSESLAGWMLGIMATELDEFLVPPYLMHASINAMYEVLAKRAYAEDSINPDELKKQIYIASSRTLHKNDDDTIKYHLFLLYYPRWLSADAALVREVGENLEATRARIQHDLNHPLHERLGALVRKHVAYFSILQRIVSADPMAAWEAIQKPEELNEKIASACNKEYHESRKKLSRSCWRSVVYLIITKFLLALVLEIPIEYLLLNKFHTIPLAVNLVFPPLLLIIIAYSTKLPDAANTKLITAGIKDIISGEGDMIQLGKTKRRSFLMQLIFVLLYGILFAVSFGVLITALQTLNFTVISIIIFLFFLSLVSLFAYRIRRNAQELVVTPPKRGIIRSLWSFLAIPVLHAGKWMSTKFARINIFIFMLDFVIEAPFKAFIKITEEWMNYVHEKKEEI